MLLKQKNNYEANRFHTKYNTTLKLQTKETNKKQKQKQKNKK